MEPSFPKGLRTLRKLDVGLAQGHGASATWSPASPPQQDEAKAVPSACGPFLRASDVVAVDDAVAVVAAALGVDLLVETESILVSGVADERGHKAGLHAFGEYADPGSGVAIGGVRLGRVPWGWSPSIGAGRR
jgi:hypothetical protein